MKKLVKPCKNRKKAMLYGGGGSGENCNCCW